MIILCIIEYFATVVQLAVCSLCRGPQHVLVLQQQKKLSHDQIKANSSESFTQQHIISS